LLAAGQVKFGFYGYASTSSTSYTLETPVDFASDLTDCVYVDSSGASWTCTGSLGGPGTEVREYCHTGALSLPGLTLTVNTSRGTIRKNINLQMATVGTDSIAGGGGGGVALAFAYAQDIAAGTGVGQYWYMGGAPNGCPAFFYVSGEATVSLPVV
jgi:hypothetical protein